MGCPFLSCSLEPPVFLGKGQWPSGHVSVHGNQLCSPVLSHCETSWKTVIWYDTVVIMFILEHFQRPCSKVTLDKAVILPTIAGVNGELWNVFNPLIAELIPICHLLALLGAHHILHISGIRMNCLQWSDTVVPVSFTYWNTRIIF